MSAVNGPSRQAPLFDVQDPGPFAGVVPSRPMGGVLSYRVPLKYAISLNIGARVLVPLGRGNTPTVAYCVQLGDKLPSGVEPGRVKDLIDVLDDPPLVGPAMLELTRWMANYYACSWGQALDSAVPAGVKKAAGTAVRTFLTVPAHVREARETLKLSPKQAEVLAILCRSEAPLTVADACRMGRCGPGVLNGLRNQGTIRTVRRRAEKAFSAESPAEPWRDPPTPTDQQRVALDRLSPNLENGGFGAFLLHGVTGSGKTEVYLTAIERVRARGLGAIVLVPEISLTPQTIRRFRRRFDKVAVLHSHLSDAERHRHWRSIAAGEVRVVVGARSAIFAPMPGLGLIVIDEEHESSFKQETAPRYHARDVAVKRAQLENVPIILGSATPALETWRNAESGRYTRLDLTSRVAGRPMPEVRLLDLRHEKPAPGRPPGGLSGELRNAMDEALNDGGQVILLLNRRGFHTFLFCPKCGKAVKCDACDIALTHHKGRRKAVCHACDAEREPPSACATCRATLHYGGIGTEQLEREVVAAFPGRRVRRMDSDTMRSPGSHEDVLKLFKDRQVDILLGTQMIAKGLDFPDVTLVGVVNADTSLHLPDFRAAERTFQLVAQVAGRTGRGDRPGKVLVQTYNPDEPAIALAAHHDYLGFVAGELLKREEAALPPYGRLVRLIARGPVEPVVHAFMDQLAGMLRAAAPPGVKLLGPSMAPVLKIRNLYRWHLRLQAAGPKPLQALLHAVLPTASPPGDVELAVDVDPMSLL